jgi:hypothetical protein
MSFCPSAWKNSAPSGRILVKFDIWVVFENLSRKSQFSLISNKNNGYFTWRPLHFFGPHLSEFFLEWEIFRTKFVEKIKIHTLCSGTLFENCAVYEIMWTNEVERGRPQMTIWRMRIAYGIPMVTNTHSEYVVLIAFYYNNGCTNAPQCYFIPTLPALLFLSVTTTLNRNVLWVQNMPHLLLKLLFW